MMYFFAIIGLIILVWGSDVFVEGASKVSKHLGVSPFFIGATIAAFGTSAPELASSLAGALEGSDAIALGNVMGSNLFNFFMVLGLIG